MTVTGQWLTSVAQNGDPAHNSQHDGNF